MTGVVIVGAQWGDEGKGKVIDFLAAEAQMVVRCQGGSNAGHTVVADGDVYKLHLVPSGILYPGVNCVIGNGVVVDVESILQEIDGLVERGISMDHLYISQRAQLILPYHIELDGLQESIKGDNKIGTTKKGIGPAYVDKVARSGIRLADLMDWATFEEKLQFNKEEKDRVFASYGLTTRVDIDKISADYKVYAERIKPYVADIAWFVNEALDNGEKVLFEGAQGTLLDVDHGTYPFVTSSSPIAGGVCTGAGIGPTKIDKVIGIVKAYTTRVGDGPFPCELLDGLGEEIRQKGMEFGTTTGRARRCGWFDSVVVRYSTLINGLTDLAITKLDVLDDLAEVKICTAYECNGEKITRFPADLSVLAECKPLYEVMPGWQQDTTACTSYEQLPLNAQKYLKRLEELSGAKISIISVGPDRGQTMVLNPIF